MGKVKLEQKRYTRKEGISMTWTSKVQYNQNDLECSGASGVCIMNIQIFNSTSTFAKNYINIS